MIVTTSRRANKENQMTTTVILNIVFAAFVLVVMLSLLGWAIVADHRASGARTGLSGRRVAVRPTFRAPVGSWGRRVDPAH
jgi:hypothetical protein